MVSFRESNVNFEFFAHFVANDLIFETCDELAFANFKFYSLCCAAVKFF